MGKNSVKNVDTRVAKTAAATSFEDEEVKVAGTNTRRRISMSANSRDKSNSFWTSLLSTQQNSTVGKSTLG